MFVKKTQKGMNHKPKLKPEDLRRNYEDLAHAIVLRACVDYQEEKGDTLVSKLRKEDIVDFFHGELFGLITDIDPDDLIKRLETGSKLKYPDEIDEMRGELA